MNLSDLHRHAVQRPEALAVVEDGREYSYQTFFGYVQECLDHLRTLDLDRSKPVAIFGGVVQSWILITAFRHLGLDTICIKSDKVLAVLGLTTPHYVTAFGSHFIEIKLDEYCAASGNIPVVFSPSGKAFRQPSASEDFDVGNRIGGIIAYTSGTTGVYKKVYYGQDALLTEEMPFPMGANPVVHRLGYMPWTAAGAKVPLKVWEAGGTVVFDRRPDWADHFFEYPITHTTLVSEYLRVICRSSARQPAGYPMLNVIMGGGFIQEAFAFDFIRKFNCQLHLGYGGTEFAIALFRTIRTTEDLIWLDPVLEDYLEIVDDLGSMVPRNREGRVRVKLHPWEPQGYYEDEASTNRFYRNGYFYPGDMAVQRDDGRIRILGRVGDVIVVNGLKLSVAPYEETARSELGCSNVCLFSRQDDVGKEIMLVVLEGATLPDADLINSYAQQWRPDFNQIKFVALDQFPRGDNGMQKVNRKQVLDLALSKIS